MVALRLLPLMGPVGIATVAGVVVVGAIILIANSKNPEESEVASTPPVGANNDEAKPTEPAQPDENNLDKIKGNKAADEAAREAGYDDAHDAKKGRGDSRVNIYNDKTTGQKWIWDGQKGSGKEQL